MGGLGSFAAGLMKGMAQRKMLDEQKAERAESRKFEKELLKIKLQKAKNDQSLMNLYAPYLQNYFQSLQANQGQKSKTVNQVDMGQNGVFDLAVPEQKPGLTETMALNSMPPMIAALIESQMNVDVPGAMRYSLDKEKFDETKRMNQYRQGIDSKRLGLSERQFSETKGMNKFRRGIDTARFNREGARVENQPITIKGVPHLQPVNTITKQPVGEAKPIGGKKGMPAESAGKVALAMNAIGYVDDLEKMFINPDGSINQKLLLQVSGPISIGSGRIAENKLYEALDARQRAASGAALTPEEFKLYRGLYLPTIQDLKLGGPQVIIDKLQRLKEFNQSLVDILDPSGVYDKKNDPDSGWSIEEVK